MQRCSTYSSCTRSALPATLAITMRLDTMRVGGFAPGQFQLRRVGVGGGAVRDPLAQRSPAQPVLPAPI
jgi:hypothetical protein